MGGSAGEQTDRFLNATVGQALGNPERFSNQRFCRRHAKTLRRSNH